MVMGWDGIWSNITMSCMGWAGLGFDGVRCMGCEGWSEGWGGTGFGMGAAGVLWMGFHGMGLLGWGGWGCTEDGDVGWECGRRGLDGGWVGRTLGLAPAESAVF